MSGRGIVFGIIPMFNTFAEVHSYILWQEGPHRSYSTQLRSYLWWLHVFLGHHLFQAPKPICTDHKCVLYLNVMTFNIQWRMHTCRLHDMYDSSSKHRHNLCAKKLQVTSVDNMFLFTPSHVKNHSCLLQYLDNNSTCLPVYGMRLPTLKSQSPLTFSKISKGRHPGHLSIVVSRPLPRWNQPADSIRVGLRVGTYNLNPSPGTHPCTRSLNSRLPLVHIGDLRIPVGIIQIYTASFFPKKTITSSSIFLLYLPQCLF